MKYKAAIFDLDGTLLDTLQDLGDSMNQVLKSQGLPIHEIEKYKYFVGNGMYNLVMRTLPPDRREESFVRYCHTLLKKEYGKRWADTTKPYEGIPELLDKFTTLRYKLAVLSNKPHEFTQLVVKKLLPDWKFDVIFGERQGVPRKPAPAGALEIADLFGIPTDEFLYFGDTGTDMITAKAAGMFAVGVLWGFRPADELLENGADLLVEKPCNIFRLIQTT
ncbi:MAG: HAD family hydrolase [Thermoanaerobacteraceae bacterium]|nr:HAD family hydrolase [Thermoanaerobacteraceae bacterium]